MEERLPSLIVGGIIQDRRIHAIPCNPNQLLARDVMADRAALFLQATKSLGILALECGNICKSSMCVVSMYYFCPIDKFY